MGPSLLVAFMAGCGNVLLTNPIWTVATRMQALPCPRRAFLLQLFLCDITASPLVVEWSSSLAVT